VDTNTAQTGRSDPQCEPRAFAVRGPARSQARQSSWPAARAVRDRESGFAGWLAQHSSAATSARPARRVHATLTRSGPSLPGVAAEPSSVQLAFTCHRKASPWPAKIQLAGGELHGAFSMRGSAKMKPLAGSLINSAAAVARNGAEGDAPALRRLLRQHGCLDRSRLSCPRDSFRALAAPWRSRKSAPQPGRRLLTGVLRRSRLSCLRGQRL